jgi:hypothetical protein
MSCQIKPVALVAASEAPEQLKKVAAEMSYFVSHSKVLSIKVEVGRMREVPRSASRICRRSVLSLSRVLDLHKWRIMTVDGGYPFKVYLIPHIVFWFVITET